MLLCSHLVETLVVSVELHLAQLDGDAGIAGHETKEIDWGVFNWGRPMSACSNFGEILLESRITLFAFIIIAYYLVRLQNGQTPNIGGQRESRSDRWLGYQWARKLDDACLVVTTEMDKYRPRRVN